MKRHHKSCQESNLELKKDTTQYVKDEISTNEVELVAIKANLVKIQVAQKCISTVKANVSTEIQTWADVALDELNFCIQGSLTSANPRSTVEY